ncbi:MAG TPA: zinc metallopeptidase [Methanoregulaceae archaeon]|nr:zinc metallopeptidase [Methanoregulaceae archaeon]HOV68221.1 zinc metallopeptidase [Methanoregulaceae archaeon]HQJ87872.1 zinc metallopeptidase [Methanoregulaceae archaeon]
MVFFFDPFYFIVVLIPTILISAGVQLWLNRTYATWSRVPNHSGLTGLQVGRVLFQRTSLRPIGLEVTPGELSDHFDPGANVVRLSEPVAGVPSVASLAVTAHELGHVQQHQTGSILMKARGALVPALRFSPTLSYLCILAGLVMNLSGLFYLGIFFFFLMVIFSIMTVPIEFDASRRAFRLLEEAGLLVDETDRRGARAMLTAAGFTYVAAAVTAILQLLYYLALARRD